MMVRPFYLPLVAPPNVEPVNASTYYQAIDTLSTLTADSAGSGDALELRITNCDQLHPTGQVQPALPLSTVYAVTSGFIRYYPSANPLPTPDQQPVGLPADLITPQEIGSLVIRVWITDFRYLMRLRSATTPRPNRIVLGRLQKASVEAAFTLEISKLPIKSLAKAWQVAGGTGPFPDRPSLEASFLQRFMAGDAEIFVSVGTALGEASLVTDPAGTSSKVAHLKLQAFFEPDDPNQPPVSVLAEDLIDSVLEDSGRSAIFDGHPLLKAINGPVTVTFQSHFWIRDDALRTYVSFADKQVTLMRNEEETVAQATTDAAGDIDLQGVMLMKSDVIWFEFATKDETIGTRKFKTNVRSKSHKARWYLDANFVNTNLYRAGYEVYPEYAEFVDELVTNEKNEKFDKDRGNAQKRDTSDVGIFMTGAFLHSTQREMLRHIKDSEESFKANVLPASAKTFTLLVEGDSWLNYPMSNDIYGHLHEMLQNKKKSGVTYNVFPLQHYGDRSDQMFISGTATEPRQWNFTRDLLSEYPIDLILCSSGGNDLAEPGISNENDKDFYKDASIKEGEDEYFDPFAANSQFTEWEIAERLMKRSFASLLRTHRWNLSVNDKQLTELPQRLSDLLIAISATNLGAISSEAEPKEQKKKLEEIGRAVIEKVSERQALPDANGDSYDKLLAVVLDLDLYRARFDSVKNNWQELLNIAMALRIPVLSHTYSYPLFNEEPTSLLGWGNNAQAGPWFTPRLNEAGIKDRRVQKIVLKALVDHFVSYILQPFKNAYKEVDPATQEEDFRFDYVDVRKLEVEGKKLTEVWRDEMHLRKEGYDVIAKLLYAKIVKRFPDLFN